MFYERIFKWVFIISVLLMVISYYFKDNLPEPRAYDISLLRPPIQTVTEREPFTIEANKQQYLIMPKFDYDLTGVVVTYNNADGFTNIWHYSRWKDFINVRDLCVMWGNNVGSGIYKNISFSSDTWHCWYSWQDRTTEHIFRPTELSNNHLLTDNNQIKALLLRAEIGDVVHFKGVLADYKNEGTGALRQTSTIRTDTGNGACEVVYIDEFSIVKKANAGLRHFYQLTQWVAIVSFIGFLALFTMTPFRPRQ
jgi:hypothetical protein